MGYQAWFYVNSQIVNEGRKKKTKNKKLAIKCVIDRYRNIVISKNVLSRLNH